MQKFWVKLQLCSYFLNNFLATEVVQNAWQFSVVVTPVYLKLSPVFVSSGNDDDINDVACMAGVNLQVERCKNLDGFSAVPYVCCFKRVDKFETKFSSCARFIGRTIKNSCHELGNFKPPTTKLQGFVFFK